MAGAARRLASGGILLAVVLVLLGSVPTSVGGGRESSVTSSPALAAAAFAAGFLSFLSPCTLPVLPAYFAFSVQARRSRIVGMTVAFFLGLATTLTLLGASATALGSLVAEHLPLLTLMGGLGVVGFGMMSLAGMGFSGLPIMDRAAATLGGSYLYGAAFGLGWSACVGPILGAVLTLLATQGLGVLHGAALAFVYALGLGAPLVLVSALWSRLGHGSRAWQVLRGRAVVLSLGRARVALHTTNLLSGLLLIGVGALLASGHIGAFSRLAQANDLTLWVLDLEEGLRVLLGLR